MRVLKIHMVSPSYSTLTHLSSLPTRLNDVYFSTVNHLSERVLGFLRMLALGALIVTQSSLSLTSYA